ncbi:hypothetical protein G7084_00385 [Weissella coleopterorum]|uniref:Uncharacterized protein n=1 Tax=Weissella coleopterorum TaxID=2714949 RepID=A0A6G8AY81_9LACO|nr:hypothetical protein [Weissella coleopterorum]QIL49915.1 hypothetical protein G7084_00385 [Weissella coleopterorum]
MIKFKRYCKNILIGLAIAGFVVLISLNNYVLMGTVLIIVLIFLSVFLYMRWILPELEQEIEMD